MALSEDQINECVARYERERDRYEKLANHVYETCLDIVNNKLTVRATVHRRTKDPRSLKNKITKNRVKFDDVEDFFKKISDLAGVRITTYRESDRSKVVKEIESQFTKDPNKDQITELKDKTDPGKHYRATHCQVVLTEDNLDGNNANLRNTTCEIQVCSLLAHVFNEIEHDLQYKELNGELSSTEKSLLDQIGFLTKAGDISIEQLLIATEDRHKNRNGNFVDVYDFITRMRDRAPQFSENSAPLFEIITELGFNSPEALNRLQEDLNIQDERQKLDKYLAAEGKNQLIEKNTSDELLVAILPNIYEKIIEKYPAGQGKGRPSRIAQIAYAYKRMIDQEKAAQK